MPSIVSRNRALLAQKLSMASATVSRMPTVERALRSVASKVSRRGARTTARFGAAAATPTGS